MQGSLPLRRVRARVWWLEQLVDVAVLRELLVDLHCVGDQPRPGMLWWRRSLLLLLRRLRSWRERLWRERLWRERLWRERLRRERLWPVQRVIMAQLPRLWPSSYGPE